MTDASRTEGRTRTHRDGAMTTAAAAIAMMMGLVLAPLGTAQADWESPYHETNTYWGLAGNLVLPDLKSTVGTEGKRPYTGVQNADTTGGLRIFFGYRVHPYIAWEVAAEWTGGVKFIHSAGVENLDVFTGALSIKGYPLAKLLDTVVDGRIQPYLYAAPGIIGAAGSTIQTPIHFGIGAGGGVDVWINESWTVFADAKYTWAFGNLDGLNYTTIGFGGAYHF